ncbi:hypothetical protein [Mycobacterium riyadhense]|nr:hypothetical protein [Mycobacterium riyadhense]
MNSTPPTGKRCDRGQAMSAWLAERDSHADPFDGFEHPGAQLVVFISAAPPPHTGSIFYWIGASVLSRSENQAAAARLVAIGALFLIGCHVPRTPRSGRSTPRGSGKH